MFRYLLGLSLWFAVFGPAMAQAPSIQDIQTTLSRAESLYYEARFKESIQLLTPVDTALRDQPNSVPESIKVKLQLGLDHIGLNEIPQAKTRFVEICALDPSYELDPLQFAPKVLALFSEARADQSNTRCSELCAEANRLFTTNSLDALVTLIQSAPKTCFCLDALAKDVAESLYKQGLQAYKENDFPGALQAFKTTLNLNPQHELASQYADLAHTKIQLAAERLVLEWRRHFEAREFNQASAIYIQLTSPNLADASAVLNQVRAEYRKGVSELAQTLKQSCSSGQSISLDLVRSQAKAMLPDLAIASDIVDQIGPCETPSRASVQSCVQMKTQNAMVRLKSRVNPQIPRAALPSGTTRFVAKVRINEEGNVSVLSVQGPSAFLNNPVKTAVEQWKFSPALIEGKPRCVETELPIALTP